MNSPSLRAALLPLALVACADAASGISDEVGAPPDATSGDIADIGEGDGPDLATPDARQPDSTPGVDTGDGSGEPDAAQNPDGELCNEDADCDSEFCAQLGEGLGVCTSFCSTSADCPEGSDCIVLTNSGGDAQRVCVPRDLCYDQDGDGFGLGPGCEGTDCNDDDDTVNLGADELCDGLDNDCDGNVDDGVVGVGDACETGFIGNCSEGFTTCSDGLLSCRPLRTPTDEVCDDIDNDCDGEIDENPRGATIWYVDQDNDRYGDTASGISSCERIEGRISEGGDCDDTTLAVNPTAVEVCDGVDNNCDGDADTDAVNRITWYRDADADGFGDPAVSVLSCTRPDGYVDNQADCDDTTDLSAPGVIELCDGIDNDCDSEIDEAGAVGYQIGFLDADLDGQGDPGQRAEGCTIPVGYIANSLDCNDSNDQIFFGAQEVCDGGIDNDCDGVADEPDATGTSVFYIDGDGDGAGSNATTTRACVAPTGYVANNNDCNDANNAIRPGAAEACNGVDDNCNGSTDEGVTTRYFRDADADGYGSTTVFEDRCSPRNGYVTQGGDCRDDIGRINPGRPEICDGWDNDCNDRIDNTGCGANCVGIANGNLGFAFCRNGTNYATARTDCANRDGMQLVRIRSAADNTFVRSNATTQFGTAGDVWIGANDLGNENDWRWSDGTQFYNQRTGTAVGGLYINWTSGEPNDDGEEDCGEMKSTGRWNDSECESAQPRVCSW